MSKEKPNPKPEEAKPQKIDDPQNDVRKRDLPGNPVGPDHPQKKAWRLNGAGVACLYREISRGRELDARPRRR